MNGQRPEGGIGRPGPAGPAGPAGSNGAAGVTGAPKATGPVVYKFGGTSVGSAERIRNVAALVDREHEPLIVVVSAMSKVTDTLVAICRAGDDPSAPDGSEAAWPGLTEAVDALRARHLEAVDGLDLPDGEADALRAHVGRRLDEVVDLATAAGSGGRGLPRPVRDDRILSAGEDLSAALVAAAIRATGRDARWVDARTLVRTDGRHRKAVPEHEAMRDLCALNLTPVVQAGTVAVVQGFVGSTAEGATTTLGRGGGDYTAALVGGAVDARVVHIWTDVTGILSGDPRVVEGPRLLTEIGFEEAVELAYFGAKVIHPGAAVEAVTRRLPLRIRSTFAPDDPGTLVRNDLRGAAEIAAIAAKTGVILLKVRTRAWSMPYGFLAKVFDVLGRHRTAVDLVAASHWTTAFTLDEAEELDATVAELSEFAEVEVVRDLATVTVVGHGLMKEPGMDALVFWAVEKTPVHLIAQASDVSLSFLVDESEVPGVLRRLHTSLIELRAAAGASGDDHLEPVSRAFPAGVDASS